jgi:hypothetical protein
MVKMQRPRADTVTIQAPYSAALRAAGRHCFFQTLTNGCRLVGC